MHGVEVEVEAEMVPYSNAKVFKMLNAWLIKDLPCARYSPGMDVLKYQ